MRSDIHTVYKGTRIQHLCSAPCSLESTEYLHSRFMDTMGWDLEVHGITFECGEDATKSSRSSRDVRHAATVTSIDTLQNYVCFPCSP